MSLIISWPMDRFEEDFFYTKLEQRQNPKKSTMTIHDEVERFEKNNKKSKHKKYKRGRFRSYDQDINPLSITQFIYSND